MTATSTLLLALTLACAVVDWVVVHATVRWPEYLFKPLVMVLLIAFTLSIDPSNTVARTLFVVALAGGLAGDVFLMLPGGHTGNLFIYGLASFLVGHVFYVAGLWAGGIDPGWFLLGLVLGAAIVVTVGFRVIRGVRDAKPALVKPVTVYVLVISLMFASAVGRHVFFAVAGAALFCASDSILAWDRFIEPKRWARLAVHVTYHLGQVGLVLSLLRS